MKYWKGENIQKLAENEIFVFGSNPQGRHGAGAAKAAMNFGAKFGIGRGLEGSTYALVTKSLKAGYTEPKTGIFYDKEGYLSVSPEQISDNIDELYKVAQENPEKSFLICYQYQTWPNGSQKKSLNGYTSQEILELFAVNKEIPSNIVFHESYEPHINKLLNKKNKLLNVLPNLIVISPKEKAPEGFTIINTTSKDEEGIGIKFSPFFLNEIPVYDGIVSKNMENAWQFSKVYKEFADDSDNPTEAYFNWAKKGWNDSFAHRYPNGKGNVPLYSFWKTKDPQTGQLIEHKWDYVTARKNIYFPLYAKAIINTQAFKDLEKRVLSGEKIALWDFDGYNHSAKNMTYEDVVNEPKYKCGHAFVLYGLLTKQLKIINNELVYDFNLTLKDENKMNNNIENKNIEYTYFFHLTSPFSNFHPSIFEYKGFTFISNEQFMMFSKAKNFNDEVAAQKILEFNNSNELAKKFLSGKIKSENIIKDPAMSKCWNILMLDIKKIGKTVQNYDDDYWESRRYKIVLFGAKLKFSQNPNLKDILMKTGTNKMVEASPYDKIWGIGLSATDAKKIPEEKWPGRNLLGKVLDEVKVFFSNELKAVESIKKETGIEVVNFYKVGKTIPSDGTYIGRYSKVAGLQGSRFANPFPMKNQSEDERSRVVAEYKEWLWKEIAESNISKNDLLELQNKKLVCYCAPKSCHGDVLKEVVELLINNEPEFDNKVQSCQNKNKVKI